MAGAVSNIPWPLLKADTIVEHGGTSLNLDMYRVSSTVLMRYKRELRPGLGGGIPIIKHEAVMLEG
jgi:hypothetical protein